jgi:tRNA (guanine26-N2/guanine27-N2)-dimethyltransferase
MQPNTHFESLVMEGKARIGSSPDSGMVFYNPKMSLNRDFAVLFALSYFPSLSKLRVCDPTTASGIRAVRYALESTNVAQVVASDKDPRAVALAMKTVLLNKLETKVSVTTSDANLLLLGHANDRFDLVDLDPFGSPSPFFESALRATTDGGILAATATDMGPLSGARPSACMRKYGVRPIRTEFEKELAIRILAGCLVCAAGRLELSVDLKFSHASDHYARLYAFVTKGRKAANLSASKLGFIQYCPSCLSRKSAFSLDSLLTDCEFCNSKTKIGGPIWLGSLWDSVTVESMIDHTPLLSSSRLSELQKTLGCINEEMSCSPFYYTTDSMARASKTKPISISRIIDALRQDCFRATPTHFNPCGFRTNASAAQVASLFRGISP